MKTEKKKVYKIGDEFVYNDVLLVVQEPQGRACDGCFFFDLCSKGEDEARRVEEIVGKCSRQIYVEAPEIAIKEQREKDIVEAYGGLLKKYGNNVARAVSELAKGPAPRYYITLPMAMRNISEMRRGDKSFTSPQKRAMYRSLIEMQDRLGDYTTAKMRSILKAPAPSFFLDESTIRGIIYKYYRKRR